MKVLVTGAAGFIGMHVANRLLARGDGVVSVDNLNDYYDVSLKKARLERLSAHASFRNIVMDISDRDGMADMFESTKPDAVINLAAQAGVRHSLKAPHDYVNANVVGFLNILEGCRQFKVKHLVFASSSSVYGGNGRMPFSEHDNVDHPLNLYAATKKSNELMAHAYSHLFGIPATGLRFFTVYGPWGRPDMALFSFTKAILEGRPIDIYNHGKMVRDFTYIDDIVEGVVRVLDCAPQAKSSFDKANPDPATSWAPWRVFNIGNHRPVQLMTYVETLEKALKKKATINFLPMQDGDVVATNADISQIQAETGFSPSTGIEVGVQKFAEWYLGYSAKRR